MERIQTQGQSILRHVCYWCCAVQIKPNLVDVGLHVVLCVEYCQPFSFNEAAKSRGATKEGQDEAVAACCPSGQTFEN